MLTTMYLFFQGTQYHEGILLIYKIYVVSCTDKSSIISTLQLLVGSTYFLCASINILCHAVNTTEQLLYVSMYI